MRTFRYARAADASEAVARYRPGTAYLGGGTNLVDLMRLGVAAPDQLIDVTGATPDGIRRTPAGGLLIGAATRNSDLAADPAIREHYPMLARAVLAGASGQVRNMATVGGNLLQRTRCPYFQDTSMACNKRRPGSGCQAARPGADTENMAILGHSPDSMPGTLAGVRGVPGRAEPPGLPRGARGVAPPASSCLATHPSDMAVALTALDASVRVTGPAGDRVIPMPGLHRLPGDQPDRDTVLEPGELITGVELPSPLAGRSVYRKVRERASFAFALVSVAAVVERGDDGTIRACKLALGGVAHAPWRCRSAERALASVMPATSAFERAADAELGAARPVPGTGYKVTLAHNLIVAALQELTSGGTGGRPPGRERR